MSVSRETTHRAYRDLLLRWGASLNLSSRRMSNDEGFQAQIDESLAVVPYIPADIDRFIDFGSGQGFPAIPIAIDTGLSADLIEADRRKAAFLTTALATLGLAGRVHTVRIETASLSRAPCITARALAPLDRLLTFARPLVTSDGCCLFLKGPMAAKEIADIGPGTRFRSTIHTLSARSNLVKITELQ